MSDTRTCSELTCEECDARTAELRARITELEADKRRLDWLGECVPVTLRRNKYVQFVNYHTISSIEDKTLRAAIDAAMSTEGEG